MNSITSSNNRNLQLLSLQEIYTLLEFYETCDREAATTRGCHLGYTDTLTTCQNKPVKQSKIKFH